MALSELDDRSLIQATLRCVDDERRMTTDVLKHFLEIDRRRLYAERGFASLWEFATKYLGYAEGAAYRRIAAMRLLKEAPEIEEKISSGELSVTVTAQAQTFIHKNKVDTRSVVAIVQGRSARDTERTLLSLIPDRLPQEKVRPLTDQHTELKLVIDQRLKTKLDQVRSLLSHRKADMKYVEVVGDMADITLKHLDPRMKKAGGRFEKFAPKSVTASLPGNFSASGAAASSDLFGPPFSDPSAGGLREHTAADSPDAAESTGNVGTSNATESIGILSTAAPADGQLDADTDVSLALRTVSPTLRTVSPTLRTVSPTPNVDNSTAFLSTNSQSSGSLVSQSRRPSGSYEHETSESQHRAHSGSYRHDTSKSQHRRPPRSYKRESSESHQRRHSVSSNLESSESHHRPSESHPRRPFESQRHIPARIRSEIWRRDQGQCTYRDRVTGRRCESKHLLEIDHILPWSLGGTHELPNLRLLCRTHNQMRAAKTFGKSVTRHWRGRGLQSPTLQDPALRSPIHQETTLQNPTRQKPVLQKDVLQNPSLQKHAPQNLVLQSLAPPSPAEE